MNKYFKKLIFYEEHWKILEQCDAMANLVEKNLRIQLWTTQKPAYLIKFNPPFYIGLIFHYYFYWWHFWIFTTQRDLLCQSVRSSDSIQNWIITQLKIFMAAHHITKGPLSYLSSPLCSFRTSVLILVFLRNSACVTVCEKR